MHPPNLKTTTSAQISRHSDEELVRLYRENQDTRYFDQLYSRHSDKVYGKCISILKDANLANDALQEIFIKILLNISKFKEQSKFSTWVYSITYNFCIDMVRRNRKSLLIYSGDDEAAGEVVDEVNDSEILETSISRLKVILNQIPVGDKAVLMMKYQDGMSIKDISYTLTKTESAVKMKIKRAKQKFRLVYSETYSD